MIERSTDVTYRTGVLLRIYVVSGAVLLAVCSVLISFLEDSGPAVQLLYLNDRILRSAQYDIIKFVRLIK